MMNLNIPYPNPGDKVSAELIREIIRAIRSLIPIPGHNMKISKGPNGTTYSCSVDIAKKKNEKSFWVAAIKKDPDTGEYEGEWKNCRFQYGYDPTMNEGYITSGLTTVEDGHYYLEANLGTDTFELKRFDLDGVGVEAVDAENNLVRIRVGTIEDHIQTMSIDMIPVIYKYV